MPGFPLGASFVPSEENAALSREQAVSEPLSAVVKYLSLRLPKVTGAQGMSPDALMQPHITGYRGPDPIVQAAIQQYFGPSAGSSPGGSMLPGSMPSMPMPTGPVAPPQVTPGEGGVGTRMDNWAPGPVQTAGGGPGNPPTRGWGGYWGGRSGK